MTTTLTLIETLKVDTRRDGAVSFAKVLVEIDGRQVEASFRARVGEEPVVIDGATITVSDAQVASVRAAHAHVLALRAQNADRDAAAIDAARAKLEGFIAKKGAGEAAAAELRAHFEANSAAAIDGGLRYERFAAGIRAIVARHGL